MPLTEWFRGWSSSSDQPPERNDSDVVSDSLMMEMDFQLKELEENRREKELAERRAKSVVDYTWLATPIRTSYQMVPIERLELEQLCAKVRPSECGRVIGSFRNAICADSATAPEDVPRLLRAAVIQVLESRPKEETVPDWLTKSLTSLRRIRPRSALRKVSPVFSASSSSSDDDLEMQKSSRDRTVSTVSLSAYSSAVSLPNFYVNTEDMHV